MSYDIVYQKKFLKIGDKIAPLVLIGSSNVTQFRNGREILERSWWPLMFGEKPESHFCGTAEELLHMARRIREEHEDHPYELFKYSSNWVTHKTIESFYASGIRNAKTLDEYRRDCYYANSVLQPAVVLRVYDTVSKTEFYRCSFSNEELFAAVKDADDFCKKLESSPNKCALRIEFGFQMDEKLENLIKKPRMKKPRPNIFYVIEGEKGNYLVRLTKYGYKYSPYVERAKYFTTEAAAEKWLHEHLVRISFDNKLWRITKHVS